MKRVGTCSHRQLQGIHSVSHDIVRVSSRGGAGGKLPPQTAQLPPQKKKRRKEKREREREKEGEGEREREREMGESIYLGIMIHVTFP